MGRIVAALLLVLAAAGTAVGSSARLHANGRIVWVSNMDFSDQAIHKAIALEIYSMDAAGGSVRRLTHDRHNDEYPAVSADGRKIAFVDECCGYTIRTSHIVVASANGLGAHSISGPHGRDTMPAWSPDGRRIAFFAATDTVWIMNAAGGGRRELVTAKGNKVGGVLPVSWMPDSRSIVFEGSDPDRPGAPYGTWSVGVDGSGARLLAAGVGQAHVSPDGRRLVGVDRVGIVTVDLRTGARKHLTAHVIAAQPAWSPDGRMIVYSSSYLEQGTPYQEITTMNADGTGKRRLTRNAKDDLEPAWAAR